MRIGNRLVWKLKPVVLAIITVVIVGIGVTMIVLNQRYALEAARGVLLLNAAFIRNGIEDRMLRGDCEQALGLVAELARHVASDNDISLVSHPSGREAVPSRQPASAPLRRGHHSCAVCHAEAARPAHSVLSRDVLVTGADGRRLLEVVTPLPNQPACRTAACHQHAGAGPVLGLLRMDYSLEAFDALMRRQTPVLALAALLAILLAAAALTALFRWGLARPLRGLTAGLGALASGDLGFRFPTQRDDEFGLVEESFNRMADRIQLQQREIRRGLEYLEATVENTVDLVITVNRDGLIQTFNRGAEQALGYRRDEVIGQRVQMLFADPREREVAIARLEERDSVTNWETRFKTKDDRICHVLITLSRLRDRQGNLIGTLGISKDITNEKELQSKLAQAEQAAAIGRAVTAIQHAVKNMLNTLRGGLYIVRVGAKKGSPEQIDEGCAMLEEGLARITGLSHNMLKYAREWRIEPEPVDLRVLVDRILVAVGQTARERAVKIHADIAADLGPVSCDPHLVHMGLMDIISNAFDALELKHYEAGETPEIAIRMRRSPDGGHAVIEIQDNGAGMPPEVAANVFTPFFSTKKKWGTGLGLALTQRIITLHDGTIAVESEPGRGSNFRITLPLGTRDINMGAG